MSRGLGRAERLRELEWLYFQGPQTDVALAQKFEVNRSTIYRDRILLSTQTPLIEVDHGRWQIDRQGYITNLRVNIHEALALYLAARRTARQTRYAQPHLASALFKLAKALHQPMTERLVEAATFLQKQTGLADQLVILETITRAWVEQRKVRIAYRSMRRDKALFYNVCPYLIEPSLLSDGAYLIGHCDVHDDVTTFKIERIEQAELKFETFEIPDNFNHVGLLRYTWGIWYDDHPPETVRLRFTPGEADRRLRESIWHPTQKITDLAEGGCEWEAQIAEWREMVPWVRGWGADCEVMEPQEMRDLIIAEIRAMAVVYYPGGQ